MWLGCTATSARVSRGFLVLGRISGISTSSRNKVSCFRSTLRHCVVSTCILSISAFKRCFRGRASCSLTGAAPLQMRQIWKIRCQIIWKLTLGCPSSASRPFESTAASYYRGKALSAVRPCVVISVRSVYIKSVHMQVKEGRREASSRVRPKQEQEFVSAKSCTFLYLTLGTPPRCIKMRWARNMFRKLTA